MDEPRLRFSRDCDGVDDSRQRHARRASAGLDERVARGVYVDGEEWRASTAGAQYRTRIRAVAETRRFRAVVSHASAAALHRIPVLGEWPHDVHLTVGATKGGKSRGSVVKHCVPLDDADVVEIDGLLVTSVARTVVDLAGASTFMSAVVSADHALHAQRLGSQAPRATIEELFETFVRHAPMRAHAKVLRVLEFAVPASDSPLESVSRVNMCVIGCPQPTLQQRFDDHRGLIGFSEFYWREFALVGEADGKAKYTDPRYRRGRSLEQVLLDEKDRADRIRATGTDVSRWGWSIGISPSKLRAHLVAAGLPMGRTWQ